MGVSLFSFVLLKVMTSHEKAFLNLRSSASPKSTPGWFIRVEYSAKTLTKKKPCDMAALFPCLLFILGLISKVQGYLHIYPPVDENDTRTSLYFALLQSFGGQYNGSGSVAGLQVALDRINSDPTLLPGYSLHYTLTDSQV